MSPQHKLEVEGKRHRQKQQSLNLHLKGPDTKFWGAHVETRRCAAHAMYYLLVSMYIRRPWAVLCTDLYVDTRVETCDKKFVTVVVCLCNSQFSLLYCWTVVWYTSSRVVRVSPMIPGPVEDSKSRDATVCLRLILDLTYQAYLIIRHSLHYSEKTPHLPTKLISLPECPHINQQVNI